MTDLEADLAWLAACENRWSISHPIRSVKDWTMVVWPMRLVLRSEDAVVLEAETLSKLVQKGAEWFRTEDRT